MTPKKNETPVLREIRKTGVFVLFAEWFGPDRYLYRSGNIPLAVLGWKSPNQKYKESENTHP